jgi:hypothetical protein
LEGCRMQLISRPAKGRCVQTPRTTVAVTMPARPVVRVVSAFAYMRRTIHADTRIE